MLNFLSGIADTIVNLITFVQHSIQSLLIFIVRIPYYTGFLTRSILNLPVILIPFMTASITIYVMFLITDRNINN